VPPACIALSPVLMSTRELPQLSASHACGHLQPVKKDARCEVGQVRRVVQLYPFFELLGRCPNSAQPFFHI
jgi:hypothetical protein